MATDDGHGSLRHDADLRVDGVIPLELFARVSRHAAEDRGHRGIGGVVGMVDRDVFVSKNDLITH